MSNEVPTFYTIAETKNLLHVSQRTIYTYLKKGKLQGVKTAAGTWRIPQSSVLGFLGLTDAAAEGFSEDSRKMAKGAMGE